MILSYLLRLLFFIIALLLILQFQIPGVCVAVKNKVNLNLGHPLTDRASDEIEHGLSTISREYQEQHIGDTVERVNLWMDHAQADLQILADILFGQIFVLIVTILMLRGLDKTGFDFFSRKYAKRVLQFPSQPCQGNQALVGLGKFIMRFVYSTTGCFGRSGSTGTNLRKYHPQCHPGNA